MKKILCVCFAVMLMLVAVMPVSLASASVSDDSTVMYVKTGNGRCLLVRSEPSRNGKVLYTVPYGSAVHVHDIYGTGSWTFIGGTKKRSGGYVMTKYLVSEKPAAFDGSDSTAMENMETVASPFTVVTKSIRRGGTINLRLYPSKSAKLVQKLLPGTELTVTAESYQWYKVTLADGSFGYIYKDYTQLK